MRNLIVTTIAMTLALSEGAMAATGLPGGASTLRESYGDWIVNCSTSGQSVSCAMSQELLQQTNRRRVLLIALTPEGTTAKGSLILPLGLALADGARLSLDENTESASFPYRVCTGQGCVVPLTWSEQALQGLRNGTTLGIVAKADNGKEAKFSVSLKGFAASLDRVIELLK
ncbi:MAG: invasion associated locus B family protein [Sphingobacteriales bacterium]|nr:MAG: invasion associated locus B family protein [Sphingobacteriales bacterium]